MKKVLMMAFVATSLLFATSCSKDDEQKVFSGDSLKGTTWAASVTESGTEEWDGEVYSYTFTTSMTLKFTTDTEGNVSGTMSETIAGQTHSETFDPIAFTYSFDGHTVVMTDDDGESETLTLNSDKTALVGNWDGHQRISFYLQ